ncbi:MAG: hypothetical protein FWE35_16200 [Streptosporangiales bacterium]|nr:hypothetical protein [Streptosporangiales bacterium]
MDLSPGQQRGLFAVIVIVLAGFAIYIVTTGDRPGSQPAGQSASAAPSASAPSAPAAAPSTAAPGAGTMAPPEGTTSDKGKANIYSWLPFSQPDLTSAAHATLAFAADYGTYSYTESPGTYIGKMNGVVTGQLASTLKASYASGQAASQRTQQKQVSQGSGGITQIRSFSSGSRSITFLVNIAQKMTSTQGPKTDTTQYAITCVPGPGNWEVNDIEYASAGNS